MPKKPVIPEKPGGWSFKTKFKWDEEFVRQELEWMVNEVLNNESVRFRKELCIKRGYSGSLFNRQTKRFADCEWFREPNDLLNEALHVRLWNLGLDDSKKVSMVIWLDKVVFGSKECDTGSANEITITTKQVAA